MLMVELVGPAGAGKTSLVRALQQRSAKVVRGADIQLRNKDQLPMVLWSAPHVLPVVVRRCRASRWFTWDEFKAMLYLKGAPKMLRQQRTPYDAIMLLDHGPVFKLATLHGFGPERLQQHHAERWWAEMFTLWASVLHAIVLLDAPDPVLKQRINARHQRHIVKGKSEQEVARFLARYRTSYQQTLAKLAAAGGPPLYHFDTNVSPIEHIVDEILRICDPPTQRN